MSATAPGEDAGPQHNQDQHSLLVASSGEEAALTER